MYKKIKQNKHLEKEILDYLSINISAKRYYHSLCVCELAVKLAKVYEVDLYKTQISALLHDCAKGLDIDKMKWYIQKNNLKITNYDFSVTYLPQVLHSYIGADIARKKFHIKDKEIIDAIKNHTIGKTGMTKLQKILFVADSLSKDRKYPNINKYRKVMFDDLDNIFKIVLKQKITFLLDNFKVLHPDIISIWNYYNK